MFLPSPGFLKPGPMQPYAQIGQNILVKYVQNFVYFKVRWLEQLPLSRSLSVDFASSGTINVNGGPNGSNPFAAATTVQGISLQYPLQMDGLELGQFRVVLIDDLELAMYEPQNLPRFVNSVGRYKITKMAQTLRANQYNENTEFAVIQDQYPYVDVTNPQAYAKNQLRAGFYGFRYRIERLTDSNGNQIPAYGTIEAAIAKNIPAAAVMAEGFVGAGYERLGIN